MPAFDDKGYLVDFGPWTPKLAAIMAGQDDMDEMTPDHWRVIDFLRRHQREHGAACSSGPSADDRFVALATNYLDSMLALNPEWATNLGDHRFDAEISDMSEAGFRARVDFNRAHLDSLKSIDPGKLDQANRIDYEILKDGCESTVFMITEVMEYKWNPTMYNPGDGIYNILARDYAPCPNAWLRSRSG